MYVYSQRQSISAASSSMGNQLCLFVRLCLALAHSTYDIGKTRGTRLSLAANYTGEIRSNCAHKMRRKMCSKESCLFVVFCRKDARRFALWNGASGVRRAAVKRKIKWESERVVVSWESEKTPKKGAPRSFGGRGSFGVGRRALLFSLERERERRAGLVACLVGLEIWRAEDWKSLC